ncbi:uncharacterized protein LOC133038237 [Cannabis sativa]|uniref:uncharacterized protein LOC133038237 n=1 Tax=Cannabis sativa TaxID=3483 RepID=UPI0029CA8736|nr:uncharacterized protein LOC133038237 [Cannabis sativa]
MIVMRVSKDAKCLCFLLTLGGSTEEWFKMLEPGSVDCLNKLQRGLRQGDPMSPLIFVLGMEYLTRILKKVVEKYDFQSCERCRGLKLNHLRFIEDVLLFSKGDLRSVKYMLQGLKLFSATSRLFPNPSKSPIYGSNMPQNEIDRMLVAWG